MRFWHEINNGPGFVIDRLGAEEFTALRGMVEAQYLDQIGRAAPDCLARAAVGIDQYHTLAAPIDHGTFWAKDRRVLDPACVPAIEGMSFFQRIRAVLPSARVFYSDLMWRIVRPQQPGDVGPIHADKWFWEAGNGAIPTGCGRFKVWVAIATEPGRNGLSVKPYSQTTDQWKRHTEVRHGTRKPVLDERPEDLAMELLTLRPGELVLFHDGLLHGGVVNTGAACRVSIEMTVVYDAAEGDRLLAASFAA